MADVPDKTANVSLTNNDESKTVTVLTDGAAERLQVEVQDPVKVTGTGAGGGLLLAQYTPYFNYSTADTALSDVSYTTLFDLTGTIGKLAFFALSASKADWTLKLTVDGVLRLTLAATDLGTALGLSNIVGTALPIYTSSANKTLIYNPLVPVDFTDGFKIEAIKTTVQTVTMNWFISYRENL